MDQVLEGVELRLRLGLGAPDDGEEACSVTDERADSRVMGSKAAAWALRDREARSDAPPQTAALSARKTASNLASSAAWATRL
jgi:hypothetical protein